MGLIIEFGALFLVAFGLGALSATYGLRRFGYVRVPGPDRTRFDLLRQGQKNQVAGLKTGDQIKISIAGSAPVLITCVHWGWFKVELPAKVESVETPDSTRIVEL